MFAALTSWDLASLFFKFWWYAGVAMAMGGCFAIWLIGDDSRRFLQRNLIFTLLGALVGFHAVLLSLLVQVGAINATGLAGMFDWQMIRFYLGLEVGEAALLRMAVLLLLIIGQLVALSHLSRLMRPPGPRFFGFLLRFDAACLVVLLLSFQATGHIAPLALPERVALVLHTLGITLWLGSLWPLLQACGDYGYERSQFVMIRFGQIASYFVTGLILAGGWLVYRVIESPVEMVATPYGRSLLVKLLLVCGILGLAAHNRWRLVSRLDVTGVGGRLRWSIRLEMVVGVAILLTTVYLSTVIGPAAHEGI